MKFEVLLVLAIGLAFVTARAQDYEDNDFAEFEVFEEEEEEEGVGDERVVEEGGGEERLGGDAEVRSEKAEDEEEAMVEDEDESDEFSHFNDEEEFIGFDAERGQSSSRGGAKSQEEPKITIANVPLHLRSNWDSFYLEMLMIAGLVVYFINFIIGKSKNQKLANVWYNSHKNLLEQNFHLVGDDGKQVVESPGLRKESENVYTLWCSGRMCVEGMLAELRFIKRQDIIGMVSQLARPSSDQLHIKVQLDDMDSFVFCLASKKTAAKLAKDMTDISTYCPEKKSCEKYGISSQYVLMNELGEMSAAILGDPKVTAVLNKYSNLVDSLHFSDQYSGPKQPEGAEGRDTQPTKLPEVQKMLVFGFNMPGRGNPTVEGIENMKPLLQLVFHLTDKLRRFKLSKEAKAKAEKNRARVEEAFLKATHAARAEIAQANREKKKRAERERMLEIDDPDKQRKWEEREQRRQMKKRAPKMKQLKN